MEEPFKKAKEAKILSLYHHNNQNLRTRVLKEVNFFSSGIEGKAENIVYFIPWDIIIEVSIASD
jgi:hypothetical protein